MVELDRGELGRRVVAWVVSLWLTVAITVLLLGSVEHEHTRRDRGSQDRLAQSDGGLLC